LICQAFAPGSSKNHMRRLNTAFAAVLEIKGAVALGNVFRRGVPELACRGINPLRGALYFEIVANRGLVDGNNARTSLARVFRTILLVAECRSQSKARENLLHGAGICGRRLNFLPAFVRTSLSRPLIGDQRLAAGTANPQQFTPFSEQPVGGVEDGIGLEYPWRMHAVAEIAEVFLDGRDAGDPNLYLSFERQDPRIAKWCPTCINGCMKSSSWRAIAPILLTALGLVSSAQTLSPARKEQAVAKMEKFGWGENILWTDPGNVASLDFAHGVGGEQLEPKPPFSFIRKT